MLSVAMFTSKNVLVVEPAKYLSTWSLSHSGEFVKVNGKEVYLMAKEAMRLWQGDRGPFVLQNTCKSDQRFRSLVKEEDLFFINVKFEKKDDFWMDAMIGKLAKLEAATLPPELWRCIGEFLICEQKDYFLQPIMVQELPESDQYNIVRNGKRKSKWQDLRAKVNLNFKIQRRGQSPPPRA